MKKRLKFGLACCVGLVSGIVLSADLKTSSSGFFVDDVCAEATSDCQMFLFGNGNGIEPPDFPKPVPKPTTEK
jgi:hypothetical protein